MEEWEFLEIARVIELETETGCCRTLMEYRTPEGLCPSGTFSHSFKACSWDGGKLLLCTSTEILWVDPGTFRVIDSFSHPWFNDLHHVRPWNGNILAVSTGLESILTLDSARKVAKVESALESHTWDRFNQETDYRLIPTTKPHEAHPNFVFVWNDEVWVTRFNTQDAICLADRSKRIPISLGNPHDGLVKGKDVWFTTTNGHIIRVGLASASVQREFDLNQIEDLGVPLGWCRGIFFSEDLVYVAYSRIRATKWRTNLSWIKHGFRLPKGYTPLPTRLVAYNLEKGTKEAEWELEAHGLSVVFGILPVHP